MSGNPFLTLIVALAILNGLFSPFFTLTARIVITVLAPALLIAGPTLVAFFTSLLAATMTLILSGVPAALFERATGRKETDATSYAVWLVTAVVLAFPTFARIAAMILQ